MIIGMICVGLMAFSSIALWLIEPLEPIPCSILIWVFVSSALHVNQYTRLQQ